ncbi:MAG: hypothetical protein SV062_10360 [Thermodesulfobacteriota bacterium]|nr:hypothetical protein [Thermodesulfobacteriota bacterium]
MQIKALKSEQRRIIEEMINRLENMEFYVEANISSSRCPYPILGHIPDIMAYRGSHRIIVEVETSDSLQDEDILLQRLSIFSKMRMGQSEFHIVLPDESLVKFQGKLDHLNIIVDKFFTYSEILSEEESEGQDSRGK